jgi:predicted TPR repeat methyltransferase
MRATEIAPSSAEAWFNLALTREASGEANQARDAWNRAASLDTDTAWQAEAAGHAYR